MLRNIWKVLFISLLGLALVSCSSGTKNEDDSSSAAASESGSDGGIGSSSGDETTLSFNPDGSDSDSISGLETVNFGYDKANLSTEARRILANNAKWIQNNSQVNLQLEGHCDSRGSVEYNLSLGDRRARAVKRYLVSLGVSSKRLSVISYGKEKLLSMGDSESAHAKNRRVNFLPIPR